MTFRLRTILLVLTALSVNTGFADEEQSEEDLFLEFIEFLGEWETNDGEWVDPVEMENDSYAEALTTEDQDNGEIQNSSSVMARPLQDN